MKPGGWLIGAMLVAGMGAALTADGHDEPGLVAFGAAIGFLAQAGWSVLCLAGTRMLEDTRLEAQVGSAGMRPSAVVSRGDRSRVTGRGRRERSAAQFLVLGQSEEVGG